MSEEADREAIVELIHRNRISIWMQDYNAYAECFVHAPYTVRWNASHINGIFVRAGWDDISARVKEMIATMPGLRNPANAHDTKVENLVLRIHGDMAWATFNQRYPGASTPIPMHSRGLTHEMRVFERQGGQWKIAFLGYLDEDATMTDSLMLQLDPEGVVLWQTAAATKALETEDDLVIRNGHLRVRDRRTDERLRAAIRWAAARDRGYMLERGALPIICDAGEGATAKVWWVIAQSGKVWFSFGEPGLTEARLAAAAAVYGLSPAQVEVARRITEGRPLTDIATELGVTTNTVRTHLERIYEKTGVRAQPALVRVLLSTVAPV